MLIFPFLRNQKFSLLVDQSTRNELVSAIELLAFAHFSLLLEVVSGLSVFLLVLVHIDASAYGSHFYFSNFALEPHVLVVD